MKQLIKKVEQWFIDRNLHSLSGAEQLTKLNEEVGELEDAFISDDRFEEIDAVGDIMVVLIGYCMQRDLDIMDCLASAYEEIKDRIGVTRMGQLIDKVEWWFVDRNLHSLSGAEQLTKLNEEVRELEDAFISNDRAEEIGAVGDIMIVLIGYCMQRDLYIQYCLTSAYEEIKDRKGKVVDGVFVKEGDL